MLIRNYGLFWKRTEVDWGTRGRGGSGTLLGRYARQLRNDEVDFRQQQGVYVLYDDNFKIIYVGQVGASNQRLFVRLRQHKTDHLAQRWSRFSWFGILPVNNGTIDTAYKPGRQTVSEVLDHIEAILLASAEPTLNLQRGRFGQDVEQYIQHIADDDEGEDEEEEGDR